MFCHTADRPSSVYRRRGELPMVLQGGRQPLKWRGVTADGKALKPHNLTEQQYKQLVPLLFEGKS